MIKAIGNLIPTLPNIQAGAVKNNFVGFKMNLNTGCDSVCFTSRVENNTPKAVAFKANGIILLGAPASGKGTMTEFIEGGLGAHHIDMGSMLREAVEEDTELGKEAAVYMAKGDLVPDEIVIGIVKDKLAQDQCKKGFILDGFPRTINQAKALDNMLAESGDKVKVINIDLDISREQFLERIVNRRMCSDKKCGASYNIKSRPPVEEGICDKCHKPLEHRKDDTEEVALARLATYEKQTKPLIEYYSAKGDLITIKASKDPKENYDLIKDEISEEAFLSDK